MSIDFNARWVGAKPGWLGDPQRVLADAAVFAAKVGAQEYTESVLDYIRLGRSFTSRTGQLEQSIGWRPTNAGALVFANAEHGPHIEYGTKPHVIKPKNRKALRFGVPGGFAFAKGVKHPGTTAQPFFFADAERREASVLKAMQKAFVERAAR